MRTQRGFSLVEMVIVTIVLGIIAAAASPVIRNSLRAYNGVQDDIVTLDKVRYVTERLARELRQVEYTGSAYNFATMTNAPVFTKREADGTETVVTITNNTATSPRTVTLGYSSPAVTSTLVDNVTTLTFTYYTSANATTTLTSAVKYVEINLTVTVSGLAYSERTRVQLRNS